MDKNILFFVEGENDEVKLMEKIFKCFPEFELNSGNIISYKTNIWALNIELKKKFEIDWYLNNSFDFRDFLYRKYPSLIDKKITDIFLIFDYERHDPNFNAIELEHMLSYFNNSIENGQLYINYPMLEAYKHVSTKCLPEIEYYSRECKVYEAKNYKKIVNIESKFQDLKKFNRDIFQKLLFMNINKISLMVFDRICESNDEIYKIAKDRDLNKVLEIQNKLSMNVDSGCIFVLSTCLLIISDFNANLIFDNNG